ncbi:MAG: glycosyltransferase family 39 protein [Planctomycetota bacterium]|nr:glycosyltransferase family 39 protein [Planctomycetota bacterium]
MVPYTRSERTAFAVTGLLGLWLVLAMPIFAQEAYYWCYSQHPDLSYFDHPPLIAWMILVGGKLAGDGALGIRLVTWAAGLAAAGAGRSLLVDFGIGEKGRALWLWAGLAVPALATTRFLATPDSPLTLFWLLSILALWRARQGSAIAWCMAGVFAGAALLGKYTAAFLAIGGVLVLLLDPAMRRQLLTPWPYLAVVTAGVVFSPVVLWNFRNDFESFRFQTSDRYAKAELDLGGFFEVVGQQFGMFNPALVLLLPLGLGYWLTRAKERDPRAVWIAAFGLPLPAYLLVNALWMTVKVNWFTPAYAVLVLGGVAWWAERGASRLGDRRARWTGRTLGAVIVLLACGPALVLLPAGRGSSWVGWDRIAVRAAEVAASVDAMDQEQGNVFLFGSDYKDAAQLQHALVESAADGDRWPVLAQNVYGERALQFEHWDAPAGHVGEDAVFVLAHPDRRAKAALARVRPHFESVESAGRVSVTRFGYEVMTAEVFLCRSFRGP